MDLVNPQILNQRVGQSLRLPAKVLSILLAQGPHSVFFHFLATPRGMQYLRFLGGDGPRAPCSGSPESQPLATRAALKARALTEQGHEKLLDIHSLRCSTFIGVNVDH